MIGSLSPVFSQFTIRNIGSSGNALSALDPGVTQLAVDNKLNTVLFIHRTNFKVFTSDDGNNGQYRYDISKDRGANFTINIGKLNPSGSESAGKACRFPGATIYNPMTNTMNEADSAYLIYFGTYHLGSTVPANTTPVWRAYSHGRASLTGNSSSFTDETYIPPYRSVGKDLDPAGSMCTGKPGQFWNITRMDSSVGTNQVIVDTNIVLNKGTWNETTKKVDWDFIKLPFRWRDIDLNIINPRLSFSRDGKYGYVTLVADSGKRGGVFTICYYKTEDSGSTWSAMNAIDIHKVVGIDTTNVTATELVHVIDYSALVDNAGNLHLAAITSILDGSTATAFSDFISNNATNENTKLYYIGNDKASSPGCQWYASYMGQVKAIRGTLASATTGTYANNNRMQAGISPDGNFGFFSYVDNTSGGLDNAAPNIRMFAADFGAKKVSKIKDITKGTAISEKAFQMVASNSVFANAGNTTWEIPYVVCEFEQPTAPVSENPIFYKYLDGVTINKSEISTAIFGTSLALTTVTDTLFIKLDSASNVIPGWSLPKFTVSRLTCSGKDNGAGATVDSSLKVIPTAHLGNGFIVYVVKDGGNTTDSIIIPVMALLPPKFDFGFTVNNVTRTVSFTNTSNEDSFRIVTWNWSFGSGPTNASKFPPNKQYPTANTYKVILSGTNKAGAFGKVEKDIKVGSSINNIEVDNKIELFPNPAVDKVTLTTSETFKKFNITIIDVLGDKKVFNQENGKTTGNTTLDVSALSKGLYLVEIATEKGSSIKKLVIE